MELAPIVLLALALALALAASPAPGETQPLAQAQPSATEMDLAHRAAVIKRHFRHEGIDADLDGSGATAEDYEPEVVRRMGEGLDMRDERDRFQLNMEINSKIFESVQRLLIGTPSLMRTLDLIVPNSSSRPIFELAKRDLRQFCEEQPGRCANLLARLRAHLRRGLLHTMDAIHFLDGAYFNWVPLGRLTRYLEEKGQPAGAEN